MLKWPSAEMKVFETTSFMSLHTCNQNALCQTLHAIPHLQNANLLDFPRSFTIPGKHHASLSPGETLPPFRICNPFPHLQANCLHPSLSTGETLHRPGTRVACSENMQRVSLGDTTEKRLEQPRDGRAKQTDFVDFGSGHAPRRERHTGKTQGRRGLDVEIGWADRPCQPR